MIVKGGLFRGGSQWEEERNEKVMGEEYDRSPLYICIYNTYVKTA
jgi:hypothetical protein